MLKRLIKRLFLALFTEELEALEIDLRARIERASEDVAQELLNDHSFTYALAQEVIYDGDIVSEVEDKVKESLEGIDDDIRDLQEEIRDLKEEITNEPS